MKNDYERWLFDGLGENDQKLWQEWANKVPCAQCPMGSFNKCCTYEPWLPNFLIGAALSAGLIDFSQVTVEDSYVWTPLGRLPRIQMLLWQKQRGRFGDTQGPSCSFFVKGRCSIWPFNGSRCRSYFCKGATSEPLRLEDYAHFFNLPDPQLDQIYELWHIKEAEAAFASLAHWALGTSVMEAQEQMWLEYFQLSSPEAFHEWQKVWYPPHLHSWGWPDHKSWWREAPEFYRFCYKEILHQAS
jgi:hypothetical protein